MKDILPKIIFALAIFVCSMETSRAQITISPAVDTFCVGGQINVTYTGYFDLGPYEYWYELYSSSLGLYGLGIFPYNNSAKAYTVPAIPPGFYEIELWDTNFVFGGPEGVWSWSNGFYIAPAASAVITPSGPTTFCGSGSVTLNNTGSSGTYQWLLNGEALVGDTDSYYVATQPGNYVLLVTNACGTTTSSQMVVTVDSTPSATISTSGPTTFCQGDSIVLGADTANAYVWSNNATTQNITVSQSGSYSVSVDNGGNCSATSTATTVVVNPSPAANITPVGSLAFCPGDSVTLSVNTENSYLWSNNATTQNITVNHAGSFAVNVTDTNGCAALSTATVVTVNQAPSASITVGSITTFCDGDSVILTANTESMYRWSSSASTQSITVMHAGTYTVKVTDANGCTALSSPESVVVNGLPSSTITPGSSTTFCAGDSVTLTANTESSYLWSNNATTQNISVSQAGGYTVVVTDINHCSASSSVLSITVDTLPSAAITASGDTVFCSGNSVNLSAGVATLYQWSNNATNQSIDVTQSGQYAVTLTNAYNCSASSNILSITVNALPDITITPASVSFCPGGNATLTASGGIRYAWSNGTNNNATVVTPDTTTTYKVIVTNANGCVDSASRIVTVNSLPSATVSPSPGVSVCQGDSTALSAAFGGASYVWTNNATTQNITVSLPGNYSVTVTSVNNCTAVSLPVTVAINPLPQVPSIVRSNDTLTSSPALYYQWYLNEAILSGDTSLQLHINQPGTYTVQITDDNGCGNGSAGLNITVLGIDDIQAVYGVQLYPNPNNGNFTLQFADNVPRWVSITDFAGRVIVEAQQVTSHKDFNCTTLPDGIYVLAIKDQGGARALRIVVTK